MTRRPLDDEPASPDDDLTPEVEDLWSGAAPSPQEPGLAALPIAGITRRRIAAVVAAVLAVWILGVFVRQVGEASAATTEADRLAASNLSQAAHVASLERELELIARSKFIKQQARGYGLGTPREIPFALAADAPPLPDDAPGSAAQRVGVEREAVPPLERWLTVLFGPGD
jgi:cell division protein FtsB